jgi:predicted nucleic-acid-binding protein
VLAVDTNVLVRFATNDDPRQAAAARAVLEADAVFVSSTVLLEAEWVLRSSYGFPKAQVLGALKAICALPGIVLDDSDRIRTALALAEAGLEFADALHLAAADACEAFVTFDRKLAKLAARSGATPVRPI